MAEVNILETTADKGTEFSEKELLKRGADPKKAIHQGYLHVDDPKTGLRTIYQIKGSSGEVYVQRGKPFPIPKD